MIKIYTLKDPITNEIRYVGKTNKSLKIRYNAHISAYKLSREKSHKNSWIISLKNKGLKPVIELLDIVENSEWIFWEQYWISQMFTWGFNLTNMTKGGEGCLGGVGSLGYKHTEQAKQNISIKNSKPKSENWKRNAAEAMRKTVAKPILQFNKQNELIKEWISFYDVANSINLEGNRFSTIKNIHACCNNKRKSAYGFIWKYKESIE